MRIIFFLNRPFSFASTSPLHFISPCPPFLFIKFSFLSLSLSLSSYFTSPSTTSWWSFRISRLPIDTHRLCSGHAPPPKKKEGKQKVKKKKEVEFKKKRKENGTRLNRVAPAGDFLGTKKNYCFFFLRFRILNATLHRNQLRANQ